MQSICEAQPAHMTEDPNDQEHSGLGFFRTLKAVAWGFFGVRKRESHAEDAKVDPGHLILAGLIAAAIFVIALLLLIRWAVPLLT